MQVIHTNKKTNAVRQAKKQTYKPITYVGDNKNCRSNLILSGNGRLTTNKSDQAHPLEYRMTYTSVQEQILI